MTLGHRTKRDKGNLQVRQVDQFSEAGRTHGIDPVRRQVTARN